MYLTNSKTIKELDGQAVEEWNIPSSVLMENAGRSAVGIIKEQIDELPESAVVVAGKGNNGGDGLVIARRLIDSGVRIKTYVIGDRDSLTEQTTRNLEILERMTNEVFFTEPNDEQMLADLNSNPPLIIDAIFGIGISGPLRGDYSELISQINNSESIVVAVDIPSGLPGDTGDPEGEAVKADITATMGLVKIGTLLPEAFKYVGEQFVASVDYPRVMMEDHKAIWRLLRDKYVRDLLPTRNVAAHKGEFGRLLVVGGSTSMTGAPILSAKSALRSGTGLVYLAVPESLSEIFSTNVVEGLNISLPDKDGKLTQDSHLELKEVTEDKDAVAIGPGIGRHKATAELVRNYLSGISVPAVIDADAIPAYSNCEQDLESLSDAVLTPHPGELAKLIGSSPAQVDKKRFDLVPELAREFGITLVLKGVPTVVSSPSGRTSVASCPNSGLAKGGSGDILTGLIGSFMAQGLKPYEAAQLGTWLHCRIGEVGVNEYGVDYLQPGDLIGFISRVLKEWRNS